MPRTVLAQRVIGLLLAVVLGTAAIVAFRSADDQPPSEGTATATSTSTAAPPLAIAPPASAGSDPVATSGPGLNEPGVHVLAQPGADGNLEVVERVRLATPVSSLAIAPPHPTGTGALDTAPSIVGLQAQANGSVVADLPRSPIEAAGDRLTLAGPATDVAMRYRLEGGVTRSQPAPVGRVLIALAPITAADPTLADLPVVIEVVGGGVHNLVCPNLPTSDQLCGRQKGRVWSTAPMAAASSLVVAQVDLPQPGDR